MKESKLTPTTSFMERLIVFGASVDGSSAVLVFDESHRNKFVCVEHAILLLELEEAKNGVHEQSDRLAKNANQQSRSAFSSSIPHPVMSVNQRAFKCKPPCKTEDLRMPIDRLPSHSMRL